MPTTRAQTAALNRIDHFLDVTDDLLREILYRAPVYTHGLLALVCKRFKKVVADAAQHCIELGLSRPVVLAFGGGDILSNRLHKHMLALIEGEWVFCADPPVWGRHLFSAVVGHRFLILIGGGTPMDAYDSEPDDLAVHAYDVVEDYWIPLSPTNPPKTRLGAVCAQAGSAIFIVGGEIVDWESEDDEPYKPTSSVLRLDIRQERSGRTSVKRGVASSSPSGAICRQCHSSSSLSTPSSPKSGFMCSALLRHIPRPP